MKAKEYAKLWIGWQEKPPTNGEVFSNCPEEERDKPLDDSGLVSHLCQKLLQEYQPLIKLRRAQTPEALGSILQELCQKYDAISNRVEGLPKGFFRRFLDVVHQDVVNR